MRRAVARGRVFPQRYSTDRRYGRLSLKACALFPLMWVNADDQGRLSGDHEEIKYAVCPNIDHIAKADIPGILEELETNELIKVYDSLKTKAVQLLDWWEEAGAKLQWARPSEYDPPEGWEDRLRYKERPDGPVITENWTLKDKRRPPDTSPNRQADLPPSQPPDTSPNQQAGESGEHLEQRESNKEKPEIDKEKGDRRRRGNRNKPGKSGDTPGEPSPSPADLSSEETEVYGYLLENFRMRFGKPLPPDYKKIKPREPDFRQFAQLRDLAKEISAAGGCEFPMVKQAFDEASGQHKQHISYVRAVLLDWLGIERVHTT